MKPFFWKRVILPKDQKDDVIWKRITDEKVD